MLRMVVMTVLMVVAHHALSQSERVVTRVYAGKAFRLVIPTGYCLVERETTQGKPLYQIQEQMNQGKNVVAAIFVDCNEWKIRQSNSSNAVHRYGSYFFQLRSGKEQLIPYSREKYLQELTDLEFRGHGMERQGTDAAIDRANEYLKQMNKSEEVQAGKLVGKLNPRLIGVSKYAVFYGMVGTIDYPSGSDRFVGVMAITLIEGARILLVLNDSHDYKTGFTRLLDEQKRNAANLIKANE